MTRRILVTGGAGFIGSHIVDRLVERGFRVVVIDNESTGKREQVNPAAEFIAGDVRQPADLAPIFAAGVDAVLHIAGQASIRLSFNDPANDLNVNTLGTINVLQQCIAHRVPRLLFASSMTIYGNTDVVPTPETTAPDPVSYYGVTKYAAERYVHLTAQRRDLDFSFNVTSLRMFNIYGERQSLTNAYQGVFAIFTGNVLRGEPIKIHADGEQSRDFLHIDDAARAWVDAIDNPAVLRASDQSWHGKTDQRQSTLRHRAARLRANPRDLSSRIPSGAARRSAPVSRRHQPGADAARLAATSRSGKRDGAHN